MADTKQPPVTIIYLQMVSAPGISAAAAPAPDIHIERVIEPPVPFYREMYEAVGGAWSWTERKKLDDEQVGSIIKHPDVHIHVLRLEERIVGFGELDFRCKPDVELKYFGLIPEQIGKGLGSYFLALMVAKAWELNPCRVWLHTCTNDHPRALETYKKAGFAAYKLETKEQRGSAH